MHPGASITLNSLLCMWTRERWGRGPACFSFWPGGYLSTLGIPKSSTPPCRHGDPGTLHSCCTGGAWVMVPKSREAMELACCTVCFATSLFHPHICNNHSTYVQHKEMDIKIKNTAVHFLFSLGLNCCFIALPYQALIDASFCSTTSLVWCIWLHPYLPAQ